MTDQSRNIKSENITVTNSPNALNLGEISGNVTNTIHQLLPEQTHLRDLLTQLQTLIENAEEIPPDEQVAALRQVQVLAEQGKNPAKAEEISVRTAIMYLTGFAVKVTEIATAMTLAKKLNEIIPEIKKIFF